MVPLSYVITGIVIYSAILIIIGYIGHKRSKRTLEDFFIMGRKMGYVIGAFTIAATLMSGVCFFGFGGLGYTTGLALGLEYSALVVGWMLLYILLAPKWWYLGKKRGYITPGDYLYDRFGSNFIRVIYSIVLLVMYCFIFVVIQLIALGVGLFSLTGGGIPYWIGPVVGGIIMLCYMLMGGYRAVVWTDTLQGILMLTVLWIVMVGVIVGSGGPEKIFLTLLEKDPALVQIPGKFAFFSPTSWISLFFAFTFFMFIVPQMVQRIYAMDSVKTVRLTGLFMGIISILIVIPPTLIGLVGNLYYEFPPFSPKADEVIGMLTLKFFPEWFAVLVLCGALAAIMSTADSQLLTSSSLITVDIYGQYRPKASEREKLIVSRIILMVLLFLGIWLALLRPAALAVINALAGTVAVSCLPTFILAMYWERMNKLGALASMLAGFIAAIVLSFDFLTGEIVALRPIGPLHLFPSVYAVIINFMVAVIVTYLTSRRRRVLTL